MRAAPPEVLALLEQAMADGLVPEPGFRINSDEQVDFAALHERAPKLLEELGAERRLELFTRMCWSAPVTQDGGRAVPTDSVIGWARVRDEDRDGLFDALEALPDEQGAALVLTRLDRDGILDVVDEATLDAVFAFWGFLPEGGGE